MYVLFFWFNIISDIMSAHVAIVYCNKVNLIKYEGSSASASFPFLVAHYSYMSSQVTPYLMIWGFSILSVY